MYLRLDSSSIVITLAFGSSSYIGLTVIFLVTRDKSLSHPLKTKKAFLG